MQQKHNGHGSDGEPQENGGSGPDGAEAGSEGALRRRAREAIAAGRLPNRPAAQMWGGPGLGEVCAVCEAPVTTQEMGFELEFDPDRTQADGRSAPAQMHIRCFAAWEFERRETSQPAGRNGHGHALPSEHAIFAQQSSSAAAIGDGASILLSESDGQGTILTSERQSPHRRGRE